MKEVTVMVREYNGVWPYFLSNVNYAGICISRYEFEAEAKRLGYGRKLNPVTSTAWHGTEDGLPPVGAERMAQWLIPPDGGAMDPEPVLIKGYFDKQVWFTARSGEDIVMLKNNVLFSPLPTKRDQWIEKAKKITSEGSDDTYYHDLYGALLSGELPMPEAE